MTPDNKTKPWQDEETLRHLYHDKRMSMQEIADHFGDLTWGGISYWMDEHGIERRSRADAAKQRWLKTPLEVRTDPQYGYETVRDGSDDDEKKLLHHRLLAVSVYGIDEVKGKVIHHKNNIPWDNRPSNIEVMTDAEHAEHHSTGRHSTEPWHDVELLHELRVEKGMAVTEMATELGCSDTTVCRSLQEYRISEYEEQPPATLSG